MPAKPQDPMVDFYPTEEDNYGVYARPEGGFQIKDRPKVNEHIVRMVLRCNMDWEAAVSRLLPDKDEKGEETDDATIKHWAVTLQGRPRVKEAMIALLHSLGLDDQSQKIFLAKLWEVAMNPDHKQFGTVAKLFADLFGWSKKADDSMKPQSLPIRDFDKGLKNMFGDSLPDPNALPDKVDLPDDDDTVQ